MGMDIIEMTYETGHYGNEHMGMGIIGMNIYMGMGIMGMNVWEWAL